MGGRSKSARRFLTYVLRHNPGALGLTADGQGYLPIGSLSEAAERAGYDLAAEKILDIVRTDVKRRFELCEAGAHVRARYGHSYEVALGLSVAEPPEVLYHGTAITSLPGILSSGITRQQRNYVHLSGDKKTAWNVGRRHGRAIVLEVSAHAMFSMGYRFYQSDSLWFTDHVPPVYIRRWGHTLLSEAG